MLRSLFSYILLLLMLSACSTTSKVTTIEEGELLVRKLVPGVYQHITFLQTQTLGRVACNGMVYAKNGEAIIFDTPSTNEVAEQLLYWVETELKCKVKAVVVNHFHVDCLGSLEVFHLKGIPSFANQQTIDLAIAAGKPVVPQIAIKEGTNLMAGGHEVINRHFGAGHTQDNIVSYLPEERVLFGGCMIKSVGAAKGNLADADVAAWPKSVAKVKAAFPNIKWVIPGHGQAGGVELLEFTQLLFGAGD